MDHGPQLTFWLITTLVLASGAVAAFARNIVQAAYSLFFTLLGMAGYYVLLGSDFLAITQVIIYVGGILVLLMFGILLTNRPLERLRKDAGRLYLIAGAVGAALFAVILFHIVIRAPWVQAPPAALTAPQPDLRPMGLQLFSAYLLPFELAGMTLLLCLIGAAYLVRRKDR